MGSKSKSSSTSTSYNKNNDLLVNQYSDLLGTTNQASNDYGAFLNGDTSGFDNYLKNAGYDFQLDNGLDTIGNRMAASGLRTSGATAKAMADYSSNLNKSMAGDYLSALGNYGQTGLSLGSLLGSTGQYSSSTSKSKSKGGLGEVLGGAGSLASSLASGGMKFSDRRLKRGIKKLGEMPDGLGIYKYSYVWDSINDIQIGVMADEVKALRPWALGPESEDGYMSVDYDKLDEVQ